MSIKTQKLPGLEVKVPDVKKDSRLPLGYKYFETLYPNIFILAHKFSGKTVLEGNIVEHLAGPDTRVIIICPTAEKDKNWIHITERLDERGIENVVFTSLYDEDGTNLIKDFMDNDSSDEPEESSEQAGGSAPVQEFRLSTPLFPTAVQQSGGAVKKKKKSKYIAPKTLILFDDISDEISSKKSMVDTLLKRNRHHKATIVISSQYLNDLKPGSIANLNYVILFGGTSDVKLKELYERLSLPIEYEKFHEIYTFATKAKYSFLYVDRDRNEYRKNFNEKISI